MKHYITLFLILTAFVSPSFAQQNKGELANLVCFVRFADENESVFARTIDYYERLFNSEDPATASVVNYFREASYGQLTWNSVMYPAANNTAIVSYQVKNNRNYYRYRTDINPDGYDENNVADILLREQNLVKEITDHIDTLIPESVDLDKNNDGIIDNITLIFSGNSEISNKYLLWPHRSTLYIKQSSINDKKVNEYILLFDGANGWKNLSPINLNLGVVCHEMSHTLGTRDLYHNQKGLNPVGVWDLMADNQLIPQGMSSYTKFKYCKWVDEIPEIATPGTYTLNPVGGQSKENIAYKIKPAGSDEFFILEYRKKEGLFESSLPASGLLVYRINPNFIGNDQYDGVHKFDEQYLFRKGGGITADGDITQAAFSRESGRTSFGGSSNEKPFYTDGSEAQFAISNVSACGETITFELLPFSTQILPSQSEFTLNGNRGSLTTFFVTAVNTDWRVKSAPDWLEVTPTDGKAGNSAVTITTKFRNEQIAPKKGELILESISNSNLYATLEINQKSDILQPPSDLKAEEEAQGISLAWKKSLEGSVVLSEDFENENSRNSWTIQTENHVGWVWQEIEKYRLPYEGNYSARLNSEMQDRHQDEWLISPAFEDGTILLFYSNSIAPGKNNPNNFYHVLVSKDGGGNWEIAYDLKGQSSILNQYEQIEIDLKPYLSGNMRIAFRSYDSNNLGLSYWWHVDNVLVYSEPYQSTIEEYQIFRNGEKIGTSIENSFTDKNPLTGDNIYEVRAAHPLGETPFSNKVLINYTSSGIPSQQAKPEMQVFVADSYITIQGENDFILVSLFSVDGRILFKEQRKSDTYTIPTSNLPKGVYIIRVFDVNNMPISRKFMIN